MPALPLALSLFICLLFTPLSHAQENTLQVATRYAAAGEHLHAIIVYKQLLKAQPDSAQLRRLLAESYLAERDGDAAAKELRFALRHQPDDALLKLRLLEAHWLSGNPEAVTNAKPPVALFNSPPDLARFFLLQGQAHFSLQQPTEGEAKLIAAQQAAEDSQAGKLASAMLAMSAGRFSESETIVADLLSHEPSLVEAIELKAQLRAQANDLQAAAELMSALVERYPRQFGFALQLAQLQLQLGQLEEAEQLLLHWAKQIVSPLPHFLMAQIHYQRLQYPDALTAVNQALSLAPEYPPALLLAGAINLQEGNLLQAQSYLERYLTFQPQHLAALRMLATVQLQRERPELAAKLLLRANELTAEDMPMLATLSYQRLNSGDVAQASSLATASRQVTQTHATDLDLLEHRQLSQSNAAIQYQLFAAYVRQGQRDAAAALADSLVSLLPRQETGYVMRALLAKLAGDPAAEQRELERALEQDPGALLASHHLTRLAQPLLPADEHFELAQLLATQQQYLPALEAIEQALALDSSQEAYHLLHGKLLLALDRDEQAMRVAQQRLALDPEQRDWLWIVAHYAKEQRNWGEATPALASLLRLDPRPELRRLYVEALLADNDLATAQQVLEAWQQQYPDDLAAQRELAVTYLLAEQFEQASELYLQLIQVAGDDPVVLNNLAWSLLNQDLANQALPFAQRAQELSPQSKGIQDTLRKIQHRLDQGVK